MKRLIQQLLRSAGYDLVRYETFRGRPVPARPWESDSEFLQHYHASLGRTLLDRRRLYLLYQCARNAAGLPGDLAECGVYQGGSAVMLARLKSGGRRLFLFDTFGGMPATDAQRDIHQGGDFAETSLPAVQALLAGQPGIEFRPGIFPDTTRGLEEVRYAFVHLDFDLYEATRSACAYFYPRMVAGGVILFDDYGFPSCPGVRAAVDEFCSESGARILALPTGQALLHAAPISAA